MGFIKDRKGMGLTEAEDIKTRWQGYTKELYKKDLHKKKLLRPHPGPLLSKKKAWGWGCRRNLRTDSVGGWHVSSYWTADPTWVRPGRDCIYRDLLVVVHQGCDRLTLDGVRLTTGVTGHS